MYKNNKISQKLTYSLLLSICLYLPNALSQSMDSSINIIQINGNYQLNSHLEYIEDRDGTLNIEQVLTEQHNYNYEKLNSDSNFGFNSAAYWVKFTILNPDKKERQFILRQDYPLIDYLDLWQINDSAITKHVSTGDRQIFSTREIHHKDFLFSITLPAESSSSFYLRFQSDGAVNIGLSLSASETLLSQIANEQLAYGAYYGGFLVLAIYNMFLFFAAKEKAFIHYLWYLISYGIYMSVHNGLAFQFLWPNNPWLANQSLLILLSLSLLWGTKFSQEILRSRRFTPRTNQLGNWLQAAAVVLLLASFVFSYGLMIMALSILTVAICLLILFMGIKSLLANYRPAVFFMIAWTTLLVSVLIYMLKTFGVLPHNQFTQNSFQIASLIEMTLLSVALSYHFNEVKKKSYTDALTFLYNRRHFDDKLYAEFRQAQSNNSELSLIVMDIDHFKKFNDNYGHAEGDKVLQFVASILRNNVRKPLLPCRYGGEEFVVILPRTSKMEALVLAERLREQVASESTKFHQVTISIGVAGIKDKDTDTPDKLFKAADKALYHAKDSGRNQVQDFASCEPTHA